MKNITLFLLLSMFGFGQASTMHYLPTSPGAVIQAASWTVANSSTNLSITGPLGAVTTVAKAAATTQSVSLLTLPAKTYIIGCALKSSTAFTGTTTLTATVGITGALTACITTPLDLKAAVSNTNFAAPLPTVPVVTFTGTDAFILALTSTIDNISSISAGSIKVTLIWMVLP